MTFNEKYKNNALLIKSFEFSLKIIDLTEVLQENKKICNWKSIIKKRDINWRKC